MKNIALLILLLQSFAYIQAQFVSLDSLDKPQSNGHFCEIDEKGLGHVYFEGNVVCNAINKPLTRNYTLYKDGILQKQFAKTCTWLKDSCFVQDSVDLQADGLCVFSVVLQIGDITQHFDSIFVGLTFLSSGQSNNVASSFQTNIQAVTPKDVWIRSWGKSYTIPYNPADDKNCFIAEPDIGYSFGSVGYVDFALAQALKAGYQVPICVINGALGSTSIATHQRDDADKYNISTVYGRQLRRFRAAKFKQATFFLWHQGEADMITDIRSAEYEALFRELKHDWYEDYGPNLSIIVVQVQTAACYAEIINSLRISEVQRKLGNFQVPLAGILKEGKSINCHFGEKGYREIAARIEKALAGNAFPQALVLGQNENTYFIRMSEPMKNRINIDHFIGISQKLLTKPIAVSISEDMLMLEFSQKVDTIAYTGGVDADTLFFLRNQKGQAAFSFFLPTHTSLEKVIAYPNPTQDFLFLSENTHYTFLSDISGRLLATYPQGIEVIDVRPYPSGIYILQVEGNSPTLIQKR